MLHLLVAFAALANCHLRRLAVRRKLEDACWRRSHAHCRLWGWRHGHAPGTQTEPQVEPVTSAGVILPETEQFLLLCLLQLWQQLQHCRQMCARMQVLFMHFTSVLQKQFTGNDTFLREANSYKRALALRNSRQIGSVFSSTLEQNSFKFLDSQVGEAHKTFFYKHMNFLMLISQCLCFC